MKQWKRIGTIKFFIFWYCVSCGDGLVHSNGSASLRKLVDVKRPLLLASTTLRRNNTEDLNLASSSVSRRSVFYQTTAALATTSVVTTKIPIALAAETDDASTSPMAIVNDLLSRLKYIPTFCIVDPQGAAYMVFKNDQAMAVGYAFTTFPGALAVLSDAQRNAKEKGYFDVWKDATITTIPLDIAVRLALKKKTRKSPKEQELDTLLMVIPGAVSFVRVCQESMRE